MSLIRDCFPENINNFVSLNPATSEFRNENHRLAYIIHSRMSINNDLAEQRTERTASEHKMHTLSDE